MNLNKKKNDFQDLRTMAIFLKFRKGVNTEKRFKMAYFMTNFKRAECKLNVLDLFSAKNGLRHALFASRVLQSRDRTCTL